MNTSERSAKGWSPERREAARLRMLANPMRGGRQKGTKNKNAYPITEAVLQARRETAAGKHWLGKTHTDETREKMSVAAIKRVKEQGGVAYKGRYKPVNVSKYMGDPTNITYRSGLELKLMRYLDLHQDVLGWSSEEVVIPYRSPIDNRMHRYFCDFFVRMRDADGNIGHLLVEVKPLAQCREPVKKSRASRRFLMEVRTWGVNKAKWAAAKAYADSRGWRFVIMTEKEINGISGI